MALSYCVTYVTGNFTDSLCSKPPPPSLVIFWCKVHFFKTWISVVFSTVFSKKNLKTINFQFFSHSWSLKCRTFFRMALDCKTICPANRENVHSIKNPNYNNKTSDMPPETLLVVRYFLLTGCWFCWLLEAATRGVLCKSDS